MPPKKRTFEEVEFPEEVSASQGAEEPSRKRQRHGGGASLEAAQPVSWTPAGQSTEFTVGSHSSRKPKSLAAHFAKSAATEKKVPWVPQKFHLPSDPEYSTSAVPDPSGAASSGNDWRDWATPNCRCMQCEVLRVAPLLVGSSTALLLDLDNWGFTPLATTALPRGAEVPTGVFLWAFFGSGFEKASGVGDLDSLDFQQYSQQH
eukprot:RCo004250